MLAPAIYPTTLLDRYKQIRSTTMTLCDPLSTEDFVVQSMPDASPAKWHIAHVTWFFETFILRPYASGYREFDSGFEYLFNSYYNAVGPQFTRAHRGFLTRPEVSVILRYREHIDEAMVRFIEAGLDERSADLVELGLNHEQQHQELLLMDIQHVFSLNPTFPAYRKPAAAAISEAPAGGGHRWSRFSGGVDAVGWDQADGFAFDNEGPRHQALLQPFELAQTPVTNGEYLGFIEDGGYQSPELWLSDGWTSVQHNQWQAPQYWQRKDDEWTRFSLRGLQRLDEHAPVCNVSFYEAHAYAAWAQARLPTEFEWEVAATSQVAGNSGYFLESQHFQPASIARDGLRQLLGDIWEWTASAYTPYPGFRAPAGAVGEYNGKFMCNQMVLRGGSCFTPQSHIRTTYRNFFYPHMRWQMGGLRLARDVI